MTTARLTIDLDAIAANWRALDRASAAGVETGAVVKADAYGLGAALVAPALARAGARRFFVAAAEEGAALRRVLGPGPQIVVLSGHMAGDAGLIAGADLVPMLNSVDQATRHLEGLPGHSFGVQLDTGMNRLGLEEGDWEAVAPYLLEAGPEMLISHLACADEPGQAMNAEQLAAFHRMTSGTGVARSLAATGGILLGPAYHFEITRPGIGLYGGQPFAGAAPVVALDLPVIQTRVLRPGEAVGYGRAFVARAPMVLATVAAGYADGILRSLSGKATVFAGATPCPVVGRVSMDLITVDVSHLTEVPATLRLIGPDQSIDQLAEAAGTIAYEVLTRLAPRLDRQVRGGGA